MYISYLILFSSFYYKDYICGLPKNYSKFHQESHCRPILIVQRLHTLGPISIVQGLHTLGSILTYCTGAPYSGPYTYCSGAPYPGPILIVQGLHTLALLWQYSSVAVREGLTKKKKNWIANYNCQEVWSWNSGKKNRKCCNRVFFSFVDNSQNWNKEVDRYGRLSCLQNSGRNRERKILWLKRWKE